MTEAEAYEKKCPTRMPETLTATHKLRGCIGASCMAWRWESDTKFRGYCGLAGKP